MVVQESPECCSEASLPGECFVADICKEYETLLRRHRQLQPRSRRIRYLAYPKYRTPKFRQTCPCNTQKKTEIIREPQCCTRTDQLAYPNVRSMLTLKKLFSHVLEPDRVAVLNRTIRKSMLSLYSRLGNVQAPREKKITPGWTKRQWAQHQKYLVELAKPKKIFKPRKLVCIWKDISLMKRYITLAKPKMRDVQRMPEWTLTPAIKNYKASARMLLLAKPKERDDHVHFQPLPIPVSPEAMAYKASDRIKSLATPPEVRLGESDLKENPFGIAPNALKGKASERVVELSQPKEFADNHTRENPFFISPAALKAKASARTIELAKPKGT